MPHQCFNGDTIVGGTGDIIGKSQEYLWQGVDIRERTPDITVFVSYQPGLNAVQETATSTDVMTPKSHPGRKGRFLCERCRKSKDGKVEFHVGQATNPIALHSPARSSRSWLYTLLAKGSEMQRARLAFAT